MDYHQKWNDLLCILQNNATLNTKTGCLETSIQISKNSTCKYPQINFPYPCTSKQKKSPVHGFVYKMYMALDPGTKMCPGYEHSHLCGNKYCINTSHLIIEKHKVNVKRQKCHDSEQCRGHGGKKCIINHY